MTFEEYLKTLSFDRLVRLWNEYCYSDNGPAEDIIYNSIEELSDSGICTGIELTRAVFFGDVKGWNDRVSFNGYGNLYSVYNLENSPIVISYLAEWLKDEEHEVYDEWIEDIQGEFSEHLAANFDKSELHKLWEEYEEVPNGERLDYELLATDLIKDNHQLFQDWLYEQEDDESALLEEQEDDGI